MSAPRAVPTGLCWCDCGQPVPVGAFFVHGHNRRADFMLRVAEDALGLPLVARLAAAGYVPGQRSLTDAVLVARPDWQRCGVDGCRVVDDVQALARHRAKAHDA